MSEERPGIHPQEPAEGADENVEAAGAERAERSGDPSNPGAAEDAGGRQDSPHPQEPAEGGEDDAETPGADRPSDSG